MTFAEIATKLNAAVDAAQKGFAALQSAEDVVSKAQDKAGAAQESYASLVAQVKDLKAQFDATLADQLKG